MLINDKQVYVGHFVRKQERDALLSRTKFNNIYVKNLSAVTTDEDIKKIFGEYGTITSAVVMKDADGRSKCFGFVNFDNADDAAKAVEALNGKTFDDKEWYVGKAQKKSERMVELKSQFEQTAKEQVDKSKGLNLFVKNLDDSIDDDKLKELFSDFRTITSCKVMRDSSGINRGSGFVAFSTTEEATRALAEMNGNMTVSKPLYVALAQRKEERRARLQNLDKAIDNKSLYDTFICFGTSFIARYAVNMISIDSEHLSWTTPQGHGIRETLFYHLFSQMQIYRTRQDMQQALPCITHGAISLDGGLIGTNGVFYFGDMEKIDVVFPRSSEIIAGRSVERGGTPGCRDGKLIRAGSLKSHTS